MRAREAWVRVGLVALGLGLAMGAAELALSHLVKAPQEGAGVPRRLAVPEDQVATSAYHPAPWMIRLRELPVAMHTVIEPFVAETDFGYRHNSNGFRTAEYTLARPPDTFRVVVVGDSCTWGQGVALEETFHARMQGLLGERLGPRGLASEVIGLGVRGSRFVDNLLRLLVHGARLEPDVIVVQFFPNDLEHYEPYSWQVRFRDMGEGPALMRLVRVAKARWSGAYWRRLEETYDPGGRDWRVFQDALTELDRWRDENDARIVFLALPVIDCGVRARNFKGYTSEEAHLPLLRRALGAMADHGYPVIDMAETFAAEAGERYLCVSVTDGHPNALAHEIMAQAVARRVDELEWLAPGPRDGGRAGQGFEPERRLRTDAARRWRDFNRDRAAQIALFDRLLEIRPEDGWLTAHAAHARCVAGDTKTGRELLASLPMLEPRYAAPWFDLAHCGADPETREAYLQRTLREIPDHSNALEALVGMYVGTDRIEDACRAAARLAAVSSYPEQYERIRDVFAKHDCARFGLRYGEAEP